MPRTLPAELEAAMDSGVYEPYLKVVIGSDRTNEATVDPISFKIEPLKAIVQLEGTILETIDPGNFRIVRGVTINGTNYTISTIWFKVIELVYDGKYITLLGEPLTKNVKIISANSSYETVIESALLEPSLSLEIIPNYEGTAAWKNYQFFPTGKNIVLANRKDLFTLLRQKYLVMATEDGWDGTQDNMFFFVATETRNTDYTITDLLFTYKANTISKKLVSRNEFNSIQISGDTNSPMHNLGFIKYGQFHPPYDTVYQAGSKSSKIQVHLKYRTGDKVDIILNDTINPQPMRIKVTEVLDTKVNPAWHMIVETLEWFGTTEGGAMPSTLEASAPYTPLITTNFNNNLDSTINNLQALAEAVDDLPIGEMAPTTTAANDFQIGNGAGAWIKKTLAQVVTILRTALDSVYAAISHTHAAGDIPATRELLTASRTYYIRTDGNDSNNGLANTSGGAFLTPQKAVDVAAQLDSSIYNVTIQLADGTYTGGITAKQMGGFGGITIQGNSGTPANVLLSLSGSQVGLLSDSNGTTYYLKDIKITGNIAGTTGLWAIRSKVLYSNIIFNGNLIDVNIDVNSYVQCIGAYTISASCGRHWYLAAGGRLTCNLQAITLTGTPAWTTAFIDVTLGASAIIYNNTYTGAATGKRANVDMNGAVQSYGTVTLNTVLPGNAIGTTATGGQLT